MPSLPIPPGYIADILCTAKRCYELRTAPLFRIEKLYWGAQWLGIMIAPNSTSFFLDETIMYHNVVLSKIICPSSCSTSRICCCSSLGLWHAWPLAMLFAMLRSSSVLDQVLWRLLGFNTNFILRFPRCDIGFQANTVLLQVTQMVDILQSSTRAFNMSAGLRMIKVGIGNHHN